MKGYYCSKAKVQLVYTHVGCVWVFLPVSCTPWTGVSLAAGIDLVLVCCASTVSDPAEIPWVGVHVYETSFYKLHGQSLKINCQNLTLIIQVIL